MVIVLFGWRFLIVWIYNNTNKIVYYASLFHAIVLNENIEIINIDITITTNPYYIREKFFKEYQGKNRFLIIVLLSYENADSDFWSLVKDSFGNISVPYAEI